MKMAVGKYIYMYK